MVLSTTNSIFPEHSADVTDNGYLAVSSDSNMAAGAIITGTIQEGSFFSMFDNSISTYCGTQSGLEASNTKYILIDLLKKKTNVIISAYYSTYTNGVITSITATFQTSLNNTDWTDVDEIVQTADATQTFQNWSEQIPSLRYLRLKVVSVVASTKWTSGRIYNLQISKS